MEKTQNDKLIGKVLAGRFRLVRRIGQGGMANVYLVIDEVNQARVAAKVLKPELMNDEELVHRFNVEAEAASSLNHPNIVKVYGVGEEDGLLYMVMQYVDGMTLKEMIDQYGSLDWRVAVPIAIQIARALETAHSHGIIHRDIKPHNIMITRDHRALVTDFGIARAATANTITISGGTAMGSVHYFSPEQARGAIVGAKADIYSLGILLYELVTGTLPFDGDTSVAVALMQLHEQPKPPWEIKPELPRGLCQIILKCIRKAPGERYASAKELADELLAFQQFPQGQYGQVVEEASQETVVCSPAAFAQLPGDGFSKVLEMERQIERNRKRRRREGLIAFSAGLLCILLIVGFFYYVLNGLSHSFTPTTTQDQGVALSNYVNRPIEEVIEELNRLQIPYQTKQEFSDEFAKGVVMDQNLPEGKRIKKLNLNPLKLTVSKGTDEFLLEDYAGKSLTEVENYLRGERKLNVQLEMESNETVPADQILRSDPKPGARLRPGYTIKLFVSTGPKRVTLPDFKGLTLKEVQERLEQLGLKQGKVESTSDYTEYSEKDLEVKRQEPEAGEQVKLETAVNLLIEPKEDAIPRGPVVDPDSPFDPHDVDSDIRRTQKKKRGFQLP